jgi:putative ABC transport system permease protein
MNGLFQDLRYAGRTLRRSPGFTLVAALTLALGVGANTAIFSVVNAVLLRPLPFSESDRLMALWQTQPGQGDELTAVSLATYQAWTEHSRTFSEWGAYTFDVATLTGGTEPVQVNALAITSSFLSMLGVAPHLGRGFLPQDDTPGGARRILLSHALWERSFGADPTIVGRTVERDGAPYEVVGVLPRGFEFPPPVKVRGTWVSWSPEVFVPVGTLGEGMQEPRFFVLGRLAGGVSQGQARSEMTALSASLNPAQAGGAEGARMHVVALQEFVVGPLRPALLALLGAVGLVLLIACVNVAGLQLARLAGHEREAGLRSALGARRSRIVQQLLTEAGLLAALGGTFGILLAFGGLRVIRWLAPPDLPRLDAASIDGRVLAFALVLTLVTGLLFGLLPALRASRGNLRGLLAGSGRGTVGTRSARRARAALLAAEVAFAVTLVTGAGLLIRSFSALSRVDPGFQAERLLTFELMLPPDRYPARAQVLDFYEQLEDRLATLPGVLSVSAIDRLPFGQYSSRVGVQAVGDRAGTPEARTALNVAARPAYFETMGIHLLRGRGFTAQDREDAPPVVVVSRTLAERLVPGEIPIGERIVTFNREWEIVGVAEDVRHFGPAVAPEPMVYFPQAQDGIVEQPLKSRVPAKPTASHSIVWNFMVSSSSLVECTHLYSRLRLERQLEINRRAVVV